MLNTRFTYTALPSRVVFGEGALQQVTEEIKWCGMHLPVVVCSPEQVVLAREVVELIALGEERLLPRAIMHIPKQTVDESLVIVQTLQADGLVAVGGGSAIGLCKALALHTGLPILAIPTTYAGSEMTPIYGITENNLKTTGRNPKVLPKSVVYDPLLTMSLPYAMSFTSAMNALAHALEGLYAHDINPVVAMQARTGISHLWQALQQFSQQRTDISKEARRSAFYGSWMCGAVLGQVSMALHHKLCHILGGHLNTPHALTHAILLPHVLFFNLQVATPALEQMQKAMELSDPVKALYELLETSGIAYKLSQLGIEFAQLDEIVELSLMAPYPNPRKLEKEGVRQLLYNAWRGGLPCA
ncbi:MAG: maleylacetate reductase [Gammaproteobacteria bacterium]|nr:maleylacetate reductase [Gammaproteobacteria bacterium]